MKSLEPFLSHLGTIRDPRRAEGKLYQLPHVLLFSILAIVTGANSYRGICTFIKTHRRRLNRAFTLGWKRAPAHTAIRYILQGLNPEDVEKVFREHAADLNRSEAPAGMRMVALDGKALKGSFDAFNDAKARQILSAFAVQLKDNQPTLCRNVEAVCKNAKPRSGVQTVDRKKRNRHETRTVAVFDARPAVAGTEWQPYVAAIVAVERRVLTFQPATGLWKPSRETAFYLSNRSVRAGQAAEAIRKHWGIENKLHYTRDVTLAHPPQPGHLRQNPQLRLQYSAVQSIRHHRPGSLRRRAWRPQIPIRHELL